VGWEEGVKTGAPDFNDKNIQKKALLDEVFYPGNLTYPSGIRVTFAHIHYEGKIYVVYHNRADKKVVALLHINPDPIGPQGLHFNELFVDTGFAIGQKFTGKFIRLKEHEYIFPILCRIADLSNEAKANRACPKEI